MPQPYSYDLRQKVIQSIELGGMSQLQAAAIFQISRSTINRWCQRKSLTGDYQAKPNLPPGNGHKITDWDQFREFAKVNGDQTQVEMAKLWPGKISDRTISRALHKIGLTRKKKLTDTEKEMKKKDKSLSRKSKII
jgi:transposase